MNKAKIANLLGQKTESMAHHYSLDTNLAERNRKTGEAFQNLMENGTGAVKPFVKPVRQNGTGA
jgi:hypothetical protein